MRPRILPLVGVSVAALALATTFAPVAGAHGVKPSPTYHGKSLHIVPLKKGNCYSSLHNDTGDAINSQNFESAFAIYNDTAADNFSVKKTCNVTGIYVPGQYYNGAGPATSETVTFYKDANGKPGAVEDSQTVTGSDSAGTFTIPLNTVAVSPGMHWVSVVVNMDFSTGGQWGWEMTSNQKQGSNGAWENPQDGFASGCTTFMDVVGCTQPAGGGVDFMFTLTK